MSPLAAPTTSGLERRRWLALVVLCVSLLVIVIDNTIVNVALPTLVRDLKADLSQLQWVVDAYTLVFAGLLLLAGTLGDRFGRRRTLLLGLTAFGAASVAAAFAGGVDQQSRQAIPDACGWRQTGRVVDVSVLTITVEWDK